MLLTKQKNDDDDDEDELHTHKHKHCHYFLLCGKKKTRYVMHHCLLCTVHIGYKSTIYSVDCNKK